MLQHDDLPVAGSSLLHCPGAVVGIIGGNGAGKSTLFRMVMGQDKPDAGQVQLGDTVVPMYVDQSRDALQADKTVRSGLDLADCTVETDVCTCVLLASSCGCRCSSGGHYDKKERQPLVFVRQVHVW